MFSANSISNIYNKQMFVGISSLLCKQQTMPLNESNIYQRTYISSFVCTIRYYQIYYNLCESNSFQLLCPTVDFLWTFGSFSVCLHALTQVSNTSLSLSSFSLVPVLWYHYENYTHPMNLFEYKEGQLLYLIWARLKMFSF